jgi:aminopeptidase N
MTSRTARLFGLVILVLALRDLSAAADVYPRQPAVDAQHYIFKLSLSDDKDEIVGETTAKLRLVNDGATEVTLDLASESAGKGMVVTSVTFGDKAATYVHDKDRLRITLDPPGKAGELREFTVKYHGVPKTGFRIGKNKHGERTYFSDNWPDKARQWLPVIDHPYDKATSEFIVTAPVRYQVIANGLLQETIDLGDGNRRTHWKQSVPIASWLNALGVAQFAVHYAGQVKGVPLQTWVFHQEIDTLVGPVEGPARKAVEFYSESIGPFPFEKLANIEAAGLSGGMELASAIFYGERALGRNVSSLVAHEIAHQWFGDSVTEKDWDDIWLSEGFATYFALLYSEHYDGRAAFVAGLKRSRDTVFSTEKQQTKIGVIHDNIADSRRILNSLVYQKGGWTLHMLRGQVGTDNFWAGIRAYYQRFRDSNVSTDDFRRVMEEKSGQDLAWFFKQWLRRPGSPVVDGVWSFNPSTKKIEIALAQKQSGDPYRLPLEIGVIEVGVSEPRIVRVELKEKEHRFEIAAEAEPTSVELDPSTWTLMQATFKKAEKKK